MDLPHEIIDNIFTFLEPLDDERGFDRTEVYWTLLLVCRSWHANAERALYRSIALRDFEPTEELIETLLAHESLRPLISALNLYVANFVDPITWAFADLIALCPNITHLSIHGYQTEYLNELKGAIKTCSSLKVLELSMFGLNDVESPHFCAMPELLDLVAGFPMIEAVKIANYTLQQSETSTPYQNPDDRSCLGLRRFESGTPPSLTACDLRGVLSISRDSPHFMAFNATIERDEESLNALQDCLSAWAGSLTRLGVDFRTESVTQQQPLPELDRIFGNLRALTYLYTSGRLLKPTTLLGLSSLQAIVYLVSSQGQLETIVSGLQLRDSNNVYVQLPALRSLTVLALRPFVGNPTAALRDSLREICRHRGIAWRN